MTMRKFVCAIMIMAMAGLSVSCNNTETEYEAPECDTMVIETVEPIENEAVEEVVDSEVVEEVVSEI